MVDKTPGGGPFKKSDAPAVCVFVRQTPSLGETLKRELNVCWRIAVHSEQLAHGLMTT